MMTLDELWESLRQDPEIKATMEEVEKSYKLFKKIENLIVADLEAKLAESKARIACREDEIMFKEDYINQLKWILEGKKKDIAELKQQLAEKDKEIEENENEWREICDGKLETINRLIEEKHEFQRQLAEKERECLKYFNEYRAWKEKCELLEQDQNQTAIAVLEKLKKDFEFGNSVSGYGGWELSEITDYIDQKIKELKGE